MEAQPEPTTPSPSPADAAPSVRIEQFTFTGAGGEYFRIWIVNLLLSIVTLGIYSAWAKVRRLRYFYGSTQLAGSSFEYHGEPIKILKGRLIALALILPYYLTAQFAPLLSILFLVAFVIALPFIVVKSRLFQMRVSSWRNIRFDFTGTMREAAVVYIGLAILTPFTLGLIIPYAMYARQKFLLGKVRYGTAQFEFFATAGAYYIAYLLGLAIVIGGIIVFAILSGVLIGASLIGSGGTMDPSALLANVGSFLIVFAVLGAFYLYAF